MRFPTARMMPLFVVVALILVEQLHSFPYLFDKKPGPVSIVFIKVFRADALRYTDGMIEFSKGMSEIKSGPSVLAAQRFRHAVEILSTVTSVWSYEKLPAELGGDRFSGMMRDLGKTAQALESSSFKPEMPEMARLTAYYEALKKAFPENPDLG